MRENISTFVGNGAGYNELIKDIDQALKLLGSFRAWNMAPTLVTGPGGSVPVVENCFSFMFTNRGNTDASVNGLVVFPSATPATALGDSRTIGGHMMDLYKGTINVAFGPGTTPLLELVQLFYVTPFNYNR